MGKKKKSKKSVAISNIKILKSGKIKFSKDHKLDIESFVKESVDDSIVSRLDTIISRADVVVDMDEVKRDLKTYLVPELSIAEISSRVSDADTRTIVIPINKKEALSSFDFLNSGVLGSILRTSTLAAIYKKVKSTWKELCKKDNSHLTNVLFIPKVMIFLDEKTGKIRNQPFYINVLIVAVPPAKYALENCIEDVSDEDMVKRYINDIINTSIKCGCKDIIINPYNSSVLEKDIVSTTEVWMRNLSNQECKEHFNSISFSIEEQNMFITFESQLNEII